MAVAASRSARNRSGLLLLLLLRLRLLLRLLLLLLRLIITTTTITTTSITITTTTPPNGTSINIISPATSGWRKVTGRDMIEEHASYRSASMLVLPRSQATSGMAR